MKTKYQFLSIHMFERRVLEAYLHDMALKGWQIDKMRNFYLRFHKAEPCELYYHVGFDDDTGIFYRVYDDGKDSNYTAFMESFGYRYISSVGYMRLFESEENNTFFSEPEIDEKVFRSAIFKDELSKTISPLIFSLIMLFFQMRPQYGTLWNLSSNLYLATIGIFVMLSIYYFLQLLPYFHYCVHHQERTNARQFSRVRAVNASLPWIIFLLYFWIALPSTYYLLIGIIVILVITMRGLLYFIQKHVQRKVLWRTVVIVGYVITLIWFIRGTALDQPTDFTQTAREPIITAQDFNQQIGADNSFYDQSLILGHMDYYDDAINYQYYHVEDTILAGYCRHQILKQYDLLDQKPLEKNGVQYYKLHFEGEDVDQYILVKGNHFLIIGDHLEEYLALFQERV